MIQVSMVGFATGGAFLSLLYYDVPYYLMAAMVATGALLEKVLADEAAAAKAQGAGAQPHAIQAGNPAAPDHILVKKT
jgi:hypothetical protein